MSEKLLVEEARRRRAVFKDLWRHLERLHRIVKDLDPEAQVYLFGSVERGDNLLSSDIDVLIVSKLRPETVLARLWSEGVKEPFEIHVIREEQLPLYNRKTRLKPLT